MGAAVTSTNGTGPTTETAGIDIDARLRRGAEEERKLLKRERRTEREVADARAALAEEEQRLGRAEERVARRRRDVAEAEGRLRGRQAARAAGPDWRDEPNADDPTASGEETEVGPAVVVAAPATTTASPVAKNETQTAKKEPSVAKPSPSRRPARSTTSKARATAKTAPTG